MPLRAVTRIVDSSFSQPRHPNHELSPEFVRTLHERVDLESAFGLLAGDQHPYAEAVRGRIRQVQGRLEEGAEHTWRAVRLAEREPLSIAQALRLLAWLSSTLPPETVIPLLDTILQSWSRRDHHRPPMSATCCVIVQLAQALRACGRWWPAMIASEFARHRRCQWKTLAEAITVECLTRIGFPVRLALRMRQSIGTARTNYQRAICASEALQTSRRLALPRPERFWKRYLARLPITDRACFIAASGPQP